MTRRDTAVLFQLLILTLHSSHNTHAHIDSNKNNNKIYKHAHQEENSHDNTAIWCSFCCIQGKKKMLHPSFIRSLTMHANVIAIHYICFLSYVLLICLLYRDVSPIDVSFKPCRVCSRLFLYYSRHHYHPEHS